jgi:hypothetical protein
MALCLVKQRKHFASPLHPRVSCTSEGTSVCRDKVRKQVRSINGKNLTRNRHASERLSFQQKWCLGVQLAMGAIICCLWRSVIRSTTDGFIPCDMVFKTCLSNVRSVAFPATEYNEDVLGEWRYSSTYSLTSSLDGGKWSASRPAPGTHWTGGWVGPRAGLNTLSRWKIHNPRRDSNTSGLRLKFLKTEPRFRTKSWIISLL